MDEFEKSDQRKRHANDFHSGQNAIHYKERENAFMKNKNVVIFSLVFVLKKTRAYD